MDWAPVCGANGITYDNKCLAEAACQYECSIPDECCKDKSRKCKKRKCKKKYSDAKKLECKKTCDVCDATAKGVTCEDNNNWAELESDEEEEGDYQHGQGEDGDGWYVDDWGDTDDDDWDGDSGDDDGYDSAPADCVQHA